MNKKTILPTLGAVLIGFTVLLFFLTSSEKPEKLDNKASKVSVTTKIDKQENPKKPIEKYEREEEEKEKKEEEEKIIHEPIIDSLERIIKKPFGIKITPDNSPVQPEKFSGYHTGVDFEIFKGEEDAQIDVLAICAGPLVEKKQQVTGYGGVAIQRCNINSESVIVIYGHLKLTSIPENLDKDLEPGQKIGILGQGFSAETDEERKHLHLGIYRGENINLLGYVQNQQDLKNWIDYESLVTE